MVGDIGVHFIFINLMIIQMKAPPIDKITSIIRISIGANPNIRYLLL